VRGRARGGRDRKGKRAGKGCIVAAAEREIKFAPQTRFSSAISRYRKRGRQTNSQPRFFAHKPVEFEPTRTDPAVENRGVSLFGARQNCRGMNGRIVARRAEAAVCRARLILVNDKRGEKEKRERKRNTRARRIPRDYVSDYSWAVSDVGRKREWISSELTWSTSRVLDSANRDESEIRGTGMTPLA